MNGSNGSIASCTRGARRYLPIFHNIYIYIHIHTHTHTYTTITTTTQPIRRLSHLIGGKPFWSQTKFTLSPAFLLMMFCIYARPLHIHNNEHSSQNRPASVWCCCGCCILGLRCVCIAKIPRSSVCEAILKIRGN